MLLERRDSLEEAPRSHWFCTDVAKTEVAVEAIQGLGRDSEGRRAVVPGVQQKFQGCSTLYRPGSWLGSRMAYATAHVPKSAYHLSL